MKSFFVALLALPAALAAPATAAPVPGQHEVSACACVNANGDTFVPGVCLYAGGREYTVDGKDYCFPSRRDFEDSIEAAFNAAWCAKEFPTFPLAKCVKAQSCPLLGSVNQPCA